MSVPVVFSYEFVQSKNVANTGSSLERDLTIVILHVYRSMTANRLKNKK
jgi:hypothetical protein